MKSLFLASLALALVGCGSQTPSEKGSRSQAQAKDTRAKPKGENGKIVGAWVFVKCSDNRKPQWTRLDFAEDGKLDLHGPGYANHGTYKLDKNVLSIDAAPYRETFDIVKLTDRDMVLEIKLPVSVTTELRRKE